MPSLRGFFEGSQEQCSTALIRSCTVPCSGDLAGRGQDHGLVVPTLLLDPGVLLGFFFLVLQLEPRPEAPDLAFA